MMGKYFHRGKEARALGKERIFPDGRVTPETRRDFYAGWDEQDRYMRPAPTPEQEREQDAALAGIREFLAASGYEPADRTHGAEVGR